MRPIQISCNPRSTRMDLVWTRRLCVRERGRGREGGREGERIVITCDPPCRMSTLMSREKIRCAPVVSGCCSVCPQSASGVCTASLSAPEPRARAPCCSKTEPTCSSSVASCQPQVSQVRCRGPPVVVLLSYSSFPLFLSLFLPLSLARSLSRSLSLAHSLPPSLALSRSLSLSFCCCCCCCCCCFCCCCTAGVQARRRRGGASAY